MPTLVIGATHDTMDPEHMGWMAEQLPHGRFLLVRAAATAAPYDDPEHDYPGVTDFLSSLEPVRHPRRSSPRDSSDRSGRTDQRE